MRPLATLLLLLLPAAAGPLTAGRLEPERTKRLRARGGSAATEKAVAAALAWLAAHQGRDGFWDADGFDGADGCDCEGKGGGWHGERVPCGFDREVTALATLAFLGAGHRPGEGIHGDVVERALARLADGVESRTLFAVAYATRALAEAFDLTGDARWKDAAARGVGVMVGSRKPDGGWRYLPGMRMASGVPTTTAVVSALHAAAAAGIQVDDSYRAPVLAWLERLDDARNGRVAYTLDAHRQGMTPTTTNAASALLIRTRLGIATTDPRLRKNMAAIAKRKPKWSLRFKRMKVRGVEREVQIGYLQHYYWQHGSEALAAIGGRSWSAWNGSLKRALLGHQRKSGHAAGSWDPVGTYGKVGGRVMSTAFCTLALESYYR